MKKIYLGSVSMEKNRWAPGKIPTFNVSEFTKRAIADGFYGIELWEHHYTLASAEEKEKLASCGIPFIFNCYTSFAQPDEEEFKIVADAVKALNATAVKFNLDSAEKADVAYQLENLKRFSELLPEGVKLLSECHGGTVMETPEAAGEIFEKLDKERFGAIIHMSTDDELIDRCYAAYGERICHIHCAYRGVESSGDVMLMNDGSGYVESKLNYLMSKGFDGTLTIEFVKFESTPEAHYENAVKDLNYLNTIYK